jgi:hypothetical protein
MHRNGPGLLGGADQSTVVFATAAAVAEAVRGRQRAREATQALPGGPAEERVDQLERLALLKAQGVLTDDEFSRQKTAILGG